MRWELVACIVWAIGAGTLAANAYVTGHLLAAVGFLVSTAAAIILSIGYADPRPPRDTVDDHDTEENP